MNDFTKEELVALYACVNPVRINPVLCENLKNKLQSLIESYCDHDWHSGGNRLWLHCIKCKANFHHA